MDTLQTFFTNYWAWEMARYHLAGAGLLFLIVYGVFRRPLLGLCLAMVGLYISLAYFLMQTYDSSGFTMEWALALVIASGLVVAILIYYAVFVRT